MDKVLSCRLVLFCLFLSSCDFSTNEKASRLSGEAKTEDPAEIVVNDNDSDPLVVPGSGAPPVDPMTPIIGPNFWSASGVPGLGADSDARGQNADDNGDSDNEGECECPGCNFGTSSFSGSPPDWFVVNTMSYPSTVVLSQNQNAGSVRGGVSLNSTGLEITEPGTYEATFNAILLNNDSMNTPLLPLFLVSNGALDLSNPPTQLGAVGSLPPNQILTFQSTGILEDLAAGTTLSILITNGGSPDPVPITVIGWSIVVHKICD
jgi:hypothetical protein